MRCCPVIALILAVTGCSRDASVHPGQPATRDSAGVTIVDNAEVDVASLPHWAVDTMPSLTIGATTGDSAYEFGSIKGVSQLPNGMIVVLNGQGELAFELRFYDSTGKHIVTHGRRGQ